MKKKLYNIDDVIEFSKRHRGETIRQILRYDSGYLKDLFVKNDDFVLSDNCFQEILLLTKGAKDNWSKPQQKTSSIFSLCKPYRSPYQYDFNNEDIIALHKHKLSVYRKEENG